MKFTNQLAAVALAAAFAAPAFASQDTYSLDNTHTFPRFEYSHFGYSNQVHRFNKTTGTIVLDRQAKTGSVDITIDAKSVDTGFADFNGHIQGEDFLNTEKFPAITFKGDKLKFKGDKLASVSGDLTIKGVTKPVTLAVSSFQCMAHPIVKKDACGANATAKIKRSDFGAGKYAPYVSDEVTLTIAVEAIKQ